MKRKLRVKLFTALLLLSAIGCNSTGWEQVVHEDQYALVKNADNRSVLKWINSLPEGIVLFQSDLVDIELPKALYELSPQSISKVNNILEISFKDKSSPENSLFLLVSDDTDQLDTRIQRFRKMHKTFKMEYVSRNSVIIYD